MLFTAYAVTWEEIDLFWFHQLVTYRQIDYCQLLLRLNGGSDKSFVDDLVASRYCKCESSLCTTRHWGLSLVSMICSSLFLKVWRANACCQVSSGFSNYRELQWWRGGKSECPESGCSKKLSIPLGFSLATYATKPKGFNSFRFQFLILYVMGWPTTSVNKYIYHRSHFGSRYNFVVNSFRAGLSFSFFNFLFFEKTFKLLDFSKVLRLSLAM